MRAIPFGVSVGVHAAALAWVASGPVREPPERPKTLYEQVIAPHEKRLVWYTFRDRLPEVSPLERRGISQPPRVEVKAPQAVVANPPQGPRARRMIWMPAPPAGQPEVRLPNMLAFQTSAAPAPPLQPRLFAPPPEAPVVRAPVALVEPPPELRVAAAARAPVANLPDSVPRPQPRRFQPPPDPKRAPEPAPAVALPPQLAVNQSPKLPVPIAAPARPEPRRFAPPAPVKAAPGPAPAVALPPQLAVNQSPKLPVPIAAPARPEPRRFAPPVPVKAAPGPAPAVAAPPQLAATRVSAALPSGIGADAAPSRPQPRAFQPPRESPRAPAAAPALDAPAIAMGSSSTAPGSLSMAVVGLNPADRINVPLPESSRDARFSAGPQLRANGGDGEPVESARIFVPGLMIRDAGASPQPPAASPLLIARSAPTSPENLRLAARAVPVSVPRPQTATAPAATRVASAPDPRLEGRTVYSMAVQTPNISSASGSWIIWFAERGEKPGAPANVSPPVPLHKVDPKYVAAAAADRVEGKVRLAAVIRRDGTVDSVALVSRLDDRLDSSAAEALRKWQFEPARRNGATIEVDAVVEIPFRLAPKEVR